MKYIIYMTINKDSKINGHNRIYIGVHKTQNPNMFDGYLGDGINIQQVNSYKYPKTPLQYAVKKYGVASFIRITLYVYDSKQEAYRQLDNIVNKEFIDLSHTYNYNINSWYSSYNLPIYQFDSKGKMVKYWSSYQDCCDFYGYPKTKFEAAKNNKFMFLNCYWSSKPTINIEDYNTKAPANSIYIFNKDGKLLREFVNHLECSKFLKCDVKDINKYIRTQDMYNDTYYVSNKMVDIFSPKPRRVYMNKTYYVYNINNEFLGVYKGKEVMKVIGLHSWNKISNIFKYNNNWYKDFYLTFNEIDKVPERVAKGIGVDVYTKYGKFIEHLNTIKAVREKYNVPSAKMKDIQQGDKYFEDYIFKYSK